MRTVHEDSTASSFYTFSQSVPIMDGMSGWKGAVWKIDLAAFFQLAQEVAPFLPPGFGLIGPQHLPGIPLAKNRAPLSYYVGVEPWSSPIGWGPPGTQTGTSKDYYACGWTCQKSCPLSSCDVGVEPSARAPTGGRTCASGDSAPWSTCQRSCPLLDTVK